MTTKTNLSFTINSTHERSSIQLQVLLDERIIYLDNPGKEIVTISHDFEEIDGTDHCLEIVMIGKTLDQTVVDNEGNIIDDVLIAIQSMKLDDIDITDILPVVAQYHHDLNGTSQQTVQPFFRDLGCNGRVTLKFSSPSYLWLLENM